MSLSGYCDECNHRLDWHGDRAIGGICAFGKYPTVCDCSGELETPVQQSMRTIGFDTRQGSAHV